MAHALESAGTAAEPRRDDSYAGYAIARVRDALAGLRYGEVTVVVHDGIVVQVERTEKLRLSPAKPG